jgi:uncharacterized FlaG/YvyC family protein
MAGAASRGDRQLSTYRPQTPSASNGDSVMKSRSPTDTRFQVLVYVVDKTLNCTIVKILDLKTDAVLRQVPTESMLAIARAVAGNFSKGKLIDAQA